VAAACNTRDDWGTDFGLLARGMPRFHSLVYAVVLWAALRAVAAETSSLPEGAPSDQRVRIAMHASNRPYVTGDTVAAKDMTDILYQDAPCSLPLAATSDGPLMRNMHRAWTDKSATACWYRMAEGDRSSFTQVLADGSVERGLWTAFPRAYLHADGSATIVEPNFNSATFSRIAEDQSPGRAVRVFAPDSYGEGPYKSRFVTGDRIWLRSVQQLLFTTEPCSLPQYDGPDAHRAWQRLGAYQIGCWYPTSDGGALVTDGAGHASGVSRVEMSMFPRGLLHVDGSITITEPNYDTATAIRAAAQKQGAEALEKLRLHRDEKP
jgi:hypothetical protein